MKDSSIFKLSAAVGLLAFVGRLIFVQPEELNAQRVVTAPLGGGSGDEIARLLDADDIEGAVGVAIVRQTRRYLNQEGWSRIAALLHRLTTQDDAPFDAEAALDAFVRLAPEDFVEQTGAVGWAAYMMGYALRDDDPEQAAVAWRIGAERFETFVRRRPENAGAWDWLYRARTYMRLGERALARAALLDAEPWADAALEGDGVENDFNFVRTFGRTWAAIGEASRAEALWTRLSETMLEDNGVFSVADSWRWYANGMHEEGERAAAELALDQSLDALRRFDPEEASPEATQRAAATMAEIAEQLDQRGRARLAGDTLRRAAEIQRDAVGDDPDALVVYARILGRLDRKREAIDALERAVELGYAHAGRLWAFEEFHPWREDPAFRAIIDRIREDERLSDWDAGLTPADPS